MSNPAIDPRTIIFQPSRDCQDGSIQFASVNDEYLKKGLLKALRRIPDVEITEVIATLFDDFWVDWTWEGYHFTASGQWGFYDFFVKEAACPVDVQARMLALVFSPPFRRTRPLKLKMDVRRGALHARGKQPPGIMERFAGWFFNRIRRR